MAVNCNFGINANYRVVFIVKLLMVYYGMVRGVRCGERGCAAYNHLSC